MLDCKKNTGTGAVVKGKIVGFDQHGAVIVEPDEGGDAVHCYCIRTTQTALPAYAVNDLVAFSIADDGKEGYIFGLIEPYLTCTEEHCPVEIAEHEFIQIDKKNKRIALRGKTIAFEGNEGITIVCGKSSLRMTSNGEVTVRGTKLLSRSSGSNKIKGASVSLN